MEVSKQSLAEERAEVELLNARVDKLKDIGKRLDAYARGSRGSGTDIENAIARYRSSTQPYKILLQNCDRVLGELDRTTNQLDEQNREARTIRADPRSVGINNYVASLNRATRALADLQSSSLQAGGQAVYNLQQMVRSGIKQLEDVFKEILRSESPNIEPMQYMAKDKPFPTIAESNSNMLRQIHVQISVSLAQVSQAPTSEAPTERIYADIRGEYLTNATRTLALASISTGKSLIGDYSHQSASTTFPMYARGLQQLTETEVNNVRMIFRKEECETVHTAALKQPLLQLKQTLQDLSPIAEKSNLGLEVIKACQQMANEMDHVPGFRKPVMEAMKPIRDATKKSLTRLFSEIRDSANNLVALPQDGAAIPLTSDIMVRLQTMAGLLGPVTSILQDLGDGGWLRSVRTLDVQPDGGQLFANYSRDSIEVLLESLSNRSRSLLKTTPLQGVFIINNLAIIDRMIQTSDLSSLLQSTAPRQIESWNKRSSRMYTDSWRDLCAFLFDQQNTRSMRPSSGGADSAALVKSLGSKEKEAIKEKFKQFNVMFDDLVARHRSYAFEPEVRAQFAKDITSTIEPLYRRFWDKYHEVDKGKGKYVKYDKNQLSSILSGLG